MTTPTYKVATITTVKQGKPDITEFTLPELIDFLAKPLPTEGVYDHYHWLKAEQKRHKVEKEAAAARGDREAANALRVAIKELKDQELAIKDGPAFLPYHYAKDITFKKTGAFVQRDNDRITHWSLVMLDIECGLDAATISKHLSGYEHVVWPTISHRPNDPRYRVILFPSSPLTRDEALGLISRIDAHLPERLPVTSKTQCLDPACLDTKGRLMYLPKWLIGHPETYALTHVPGAPVTASSFPVTPEQQARISARLLEGEEAKKTAIKQRFETNPKHLDAAVVVSKIIKGKTVYFLNPDGYLDTERGYIRVGDISKKISGVACPVHGDATGSEFVAVNNLSGRPQLVCKHCGVIKMLPPQPPLEDDTPDDIQLVFKPKASSTGTSTPRLTAPRAARKASNTLVFAEPPNIVELHERYLPNELLDWLPSQGVVAIRSPKGSGKTEQLAELVKRNKKAHRSTLLIGHRVHLLRNLSERTTLDNYQDLPDGTLTSFSAVCMNSLATRGDQHVTYDTIIIDESEQVLRALVGGHLKERNAVYIQFHHYIKHARLVVCLDADLTSSLTLEVLHLLRGDRDDDQALGIINTFPAGQGRRTMLYADKHHLLRDAVVDAQGSRHVYYATNSRAHANVVARIFETLGKKVLLVTSETGEEAHVQAFIENPAAEAVKYDCLVTSPTLSTGVSIDALDGRHHFDVVYGHFILNTGTFLDADQALCRVRNEAAEHRVWLAGNDPDGGVQSKRELEIFDTLLEKHRLASLVLPGQRGNVSREQRTWATICATLEARESEWSIYMPQQFRAARAAIGWTIESVPPNITASKEGAAVFKEHKNADDGHADAVLAAQILTPMEYETLLDKRNRSRAEALAIERYRYALELSKIGEPLTFDNIVKAIEQRLLRALRFARTHLLHSDQRRTADDIASRQANAVTFTDNRTDVKEHEILVYLCAAARIDFATLHREANDGPVEIDAETLQRVATAYEARQRECNLFFQARIKDPTHEKSLAKVWNATIGKHTTPLLAKRVQQNGARGRKYFIHREAVDLILRRMAASPDY